MNQTSPIAMITGATSGIGRACASLLASHGYRLIITGRRQERLDAFVNAHPDTPIHTLCFDISDRAACEKAIAELPEAFAAIDVLINNAGLALGLERSHETDADQWDEMIATNVRGLSMCTRAVLPGMIAHDRGYIINIGSTAGLYAYRGSNVYGGTKAFVHEFTRGLRSDLIGTHVRASCIAPALTETEFSQVRFSGDAERAATVYDGLEVLQADDIAATIWWLINTPAHMNVNFMEVMPTCQAPGGLAIEAPKKRA